MQENLTGKEKILESALVEFAGSGFEGARVDRIAKEAGVNKALIYYHFNSKRELYVATINHLFQKAFPDEVVLPAEMTVKQKMMLMMKQFLFFLHYNPLFVKIMDQAVQMDKEIFEKVYAQNHFYDIGLELYHQGVSSGEIREVEDPVDYLVAFLGACYFFYSHRNGINKFYQNPLSESEVLDMRKRTMEDIMERVFFRK